MIKTLLVYILLITSCLSGKVTNDTKLIQNHWIHSHEDDQGNIKVFKPSTFNFPVSRGREEIILKENGVLMYKPISPNDEPIFFEGTWKIKKSKLILIFKNQEIIYKIIEIEKDTLNLKKI